MPIASRRSKSGTMRFSGSGNCSTIGTRFISRELRSASAASRSAPRRPRLMSSRTVLCRRARRPRPPAIVELNPEGAVIAPPVARARRLDARRRQRSSINPERLAGQRPIELRWMIHQVAADLIARVRHAIGQAIAARLQQQFRRLDAVRRDHEDLAGRAILRAVGTRHRQRRDAAIGADIDVRHDRLGHDLRAGPLRLGDVCRRVVLRLHRTNRNAAAAAATRGPVVVAF